MDIIFAFGFHRVHSLDAHRRRLAAVQFEFLIWLLLLLCAVCRRAAAAAIAFAGELATENGFAFVCL